MVLLCTGLSASSHAKSHSVSTLFFTHQVLSVVCTDLGKLFCQAMDLAGLWDLTFVSILNNVVVVVLLLKIKSK